MAMMTGTVRSGETRIPLSVRGRNTREHDIEAVVDTGYTASITLPGSIIKALGLHWQGIGRGTLANGSECLFDVYVAEVLWDGQMRRVLVDEADADPLVGMALLSGFELTIEVRDRGKVEITEIVG